MKKKMQIVNSRLFAWDWKSRREWEERLFSQGRNMEEFEEEMKEKEDEEEKEEEEEEEEVE